MTTAVIEPDDTTSEFEDFYTAHFGDTVAMTYGFTADLGEAQDIAQEAFCRAWQRWRQLSTYDNPVAWVRRVATNLAHSRWRRVRVAASYLVRQRPPEPAPAIDPDHVAVVAALRKLPADQRRAVVLHHLLDLPVTQVAEELELPVGTVKSLLYRGRNSLADDLDIDVRGSIKTPPTGEVVKRARKQQRARAGGAAAALLAVLGGVFTALNLTGTGTAPPDTDAATAAPTADDPMRGVDWSTATITLDNPLTTCPTGTVTFAPREAGPLTWAPGQGWPKASFDPSLVSLGDLTGDGRAEAALIVTCFLEPQSDDQPHRLLVVQRGDDGSLRGLGWADLPGSVASQTRISGQTLYAEVRPHPSVQAWETMPPAEVRSWRWDGDSLEPTTPGVVSSPTPGARSTR